MATTGEQTVEIWCGVLGDGSMFPVEIARNATAADLRAAIYKEERFEGRVSFQASAIRLFMAEDPQVGDVRLHGDSKLGPFLKDSQVPETGFKEMDPLCRLDADECFGSTFPTKEDELHVLVKLPDGSFGGDALTLVQVIQSAYEVLEAKRRRTVGHFRGMSETPAPAQSVELVPPPALYNGSHVAIAAALLDKLFAPAESVELGPPPVVHNEHYRTVSAVLLSKCGLAAPCADTVMLYCRREVRDLWAYVAQETVVKDAIVFIVGPPGTGKSLSVLCYVTQLDPNEWNVVWIHLGESRDSCLSMGSREYWKAIDLETFVVPRVAGKKLFVCLDGFKDTPTHADCLSRILCGGMTGDRYLVCTSVSTMGRINEEDAEVEQLRTFYMPSWTRDDYDAAIADATFYEQVESKLDATSDFEVNDAGDGEDWSDAEKKKHALDLKFYYAGGSCRFMFQRTTEQVKQRLQRAVASVRNRTDLVRYCTALWQDDTIDVLYGMAGGKSGRFPVSSYAAFLFARASDAETIALLARRL